MPANKNYKWTYLIDPERCMTCGTCEWECRDDAIYVKDFAVFDINQENCNRCARCYNACPAEAIQKVPFEQAS